MLRRLFLLLFAGLPFDELKLNAFAEAYNKYILSLSQGLNDKRLWRRVEEAWKRLTN